MIKNFEEFVLNEEKLSGGSFSKDSREYLENNIRYITKEKKGVVFFQNKDEKRMDEIQKMIEKYKEEIFVIEGKPTEEKIKKEIEENSDKVLCFYDTSYMFDDKETMKYILQAAVEGNTRIIFNQHLDEKTIENISSAVRARFSTMIFTDYLD